MIDQLVQEVILMVIELDRSWIGRLSARSRSGEKNFDRLNGGERWHGYDEGDGGKVDDHAVRSSGTPVLDLDGLAFSRSVRLGSLVAGTIWTSSSWRGAVSDR